jgi:dTDP-4-amino-4,6-dideoxygalactose transaminase
MLYDRHLAAPGAEVFERHRDLTPNISGRMDHLRAAILRPQLADLATQCQRWTERYRMLETGLRDTPGLSVVERPEAESIVGSSIQFLLKGWTGAKIKDVLARCLARGVELKWFGAERAVGFTSSHHNWRYLPESQLPQTDRVLAGLIDMRVPLTFSLEDCALIARIIRGEVSAVYQSA